MVGPIIFLPVRHVHMFTSLPAQTYYYYEENRLETLLALSCLAPPI
jgi:hypothetical protein